MRGLPESLPHDGLLVGWSLEAVRRRPLIGFHPRAGEQEAPASTLEPILDTGEGHLLTVAPTGAGKGTGCIIPALLRYPGPVVVVDPKGENYAVTAKRRREMGQKVILLDPFRVAPAEERHRFNPLDLASPRSERFVEDVRTLAQLSSANTNASRQSRDPFWPQMGQNLVTAVLLDVLTMKDSQEATLPAARALVHQSVEQLAQRAQAWEQAEHPELRRLAGLLSNPAAETMGGYWAYAINNLSFLQGERVEENLGGSDLDLNEVYRGAPLSVYLVLPPDKLESHAALLRLWIGTLISVITRRSRRPAKSTLFLVDEAAQLGDLPQLRQAVTLLRGYGVRVWSFWQDLSQLMQRYPDDWKTVVNNCRIQQYFGATTGMAAESIVRTSGYDGPPEAVLELERDEMILNLGGDEPVIARKPNYRFDPPFQGLYEENPFYAGQGDEDPSARTRPVFYKSRAPAARQRARTLRQSMILSQQIFHPVPKREWRVLEGEERRRRLEQAGLTNPEVLDDSRIGIRRCRLSFYDNYDWYNIVDQRRSPARHAYYLLGPEKGHWIPGNTDLIHEINEEEGLFLNRQNVKHYLEFFCTTAQTEKGRFLVVESASELEWREPPDEDVLEDLQLIIRPPRLLAAGPDESDVQEFWLDADLVYEDAIFRSRFRIQAHDGNVVMEEDDPLAEGLPLVLDSQRLRYIGGFNRDGEFTAFN